MNKKNFDADTFPVLVTIEPDIGKVKFYFLIQVRVC
jgi:hypothetical protein